MCTGNTIKDSSKRPLRGPRHGTRGQQHPQSQLPVARVHIHGAHQRPRPSGRWAGLAQGNPRVQSPLTRTLRSGLEDRGDQADGPPEPIVTLWALGCTPWRQETPLTPSMLGSSVHGVGPFDSGQRGRHTPSHLTFRSGEWVPELRVTAHVSCVHSLRVAATCQSHMSLSKGYC